MTPRLSKLALAVWTGTLCVSSPIGAQSAGTSTEGALFLLLPVGAQAVSVGRAMTTVEGPESAFWNPAGLAGARRSQFVLFRGDQVAGTATAATAAFTRPGLGTLGASYLLLDVGDQDLTDENGNVLGTVTVRNHLGVLSGAAELIDGVRLGLSFKVVQFRLSCRGICQDEGTTATTYAFDVGGQATPSERLRLGAMAAHVGPALQVRNAAQADPLPARIRLAASYDVVSVITDVEALQGWLTVEVQDRLRDLGVPSLYLGADFTAGTTDALSVRAGWVFTDPLEKVQGSDPADGARVGLGIRFDRLDMSIAKSLAVSSLTGETEPVHVTFSIGF